MSLIAPSSAETHLVELLERISVRMTRQAAGLRPVGVRALRLIGGSGRRGAIQADLALALQMSTPVVSRLCDTLERGGLIVREDHTTDRRKKTVRLTEDGRRQLTACDQAAALEAAAAGLSPHEMENLTGLLARVAAGLSSPTRPAACRQCRLGGC